MLTVMLLAAMEKALLLMLVFFGIIVVIGIYDAWSKKRGVVGWIVSVLTAVVGGAAVMAVCVGIGDAMVRWWPQSPAGEAFLAITPVLMLAGAWAAVRVVNRFR